MKETVKLRGGRMASFRVIGSGIPALMIPGDPGTGAAQVAETATLFPRVLRSHLLDPAPAVDATAAGDPGRSLPRDHARFYEEARDALGLSRVVVLGHSHGAAVALAYTALYPQNVVACIAVAPRGTGTPRTAALLRRIRRPALVMTGESDSVTESAAETAARGIPGAQLTVLPDCGYRPAAEAPGALRDAVLDFLRVSYCA